MTWMGKFINVRLWSILEPLKVFMNIDFDNWDEVEKLRRQRVKEELIIRQKIIDGDELAYENLIKHQKEDIALKRLASKHGFFNWD